METDTMKTKTIEQKRQYFLKHFLTSLNSFHALPVIVYLSGLYEYSFRYADPEAYKEFQHENSFLIYSKLSILFYGACDIDTQKHFLFLFNNPFSEIMTGNINPEKTFQNAFECLKSNEFMNQWKRTD